MIKAILFDFDGVIVNSREVGNACLRKTMQNYGLPIATDEDLKPYWGLNTNIKFERLFPKLAKKQIDEMTQQVYDCNMEIARDIPIVPNALQVLKKFKKTYKLALVTSRGKKTTTIVCKKYKIDSVFEIMINRQDVTNLKPHPEPIEKALHHLKISKNHAIFVGDTKVDVQAAKSAGIPCIIINKFNESWGADYLIDEIKNLPELLLKI